MEEQHPIEGLMVTAMNSIKDMIDVNTIIGDPINALNNTVIIPISKVSFGFAAGGSEFNDETVNSYNRKEKEENIKYKLPFGGGSGAGVNIVPVAFLIVQNDSVKILEATHGTVLDKIAEYIPDAIEKINQLFNKKIEKDIKEDEEDDDEDMEWDDDEYIIDDDDNMTDDENDFIDDEDNVIDDDASTDGEKNNSNSKNIVENKDEDIIKANNKKTNKNFLKNVKKIQKDDDQEDE